MPSGGSGGFLLLNTELERDLRKGKVLGARMADVPSQRYEETLVGEYTINHFAETVS